MSSLAKLSALAATVFAVIAVACSSDAPKANPDTCSNGVRDPNEAGLDCGGACSAKCAESQTCKLATDCASGSCGVALVDNTMDPTGGGSVSTTAAPDCATASCICLPPSGKDGAKNGVETDVDCGGPEAPRCNFRQVCAVASDCRSGKCENGACAASTSDGARNGIETDVDCGGGLPNKCAVGRRCLQATDCDSNACVGRICQKAAHTDGAKNLDETDVDCGGADPIARCMDGFSCINRTDCISKACSPSSKRCVTPAIDGLQNGDESDIDCGGPSAPGCATGKKCTTGTDCENLVCTATTCAAPTSTDGVKNGDESDADCGGSSTGAPKCGLDKSCRTAADCSSDGCNYKKKCIFYRSCEARYGGDTCGSGEIGDGTEQHESCCATRTVQKPGRAAVKLGKYLVTAGRFRTFVERVGGNVRDAVSAKWPAVLAPYLSYLPTTLNDARDQLGPVAVPWEWPATPAEIAQYPRAIWAARGCQNQFGGGRTYFQNRPEDVQSYPQDVLDQKMMNCVTKIMLLAFCIWDGGDLPLAADMDYAWTGPSNFKFPWGNAPALPVTDFNDSTYVVHRYNYQYPAFIAPDSSYLVPAPGRRPAGNGPLGHADLAGATYQFEKDALFQINGSWERHIPREYGGSTGDATLMWNRRYYAMGGRCVYPSTSP
jgi:formylglycine-generating enzyme required for sulfatase activity